MSPGAQEPQSPRTSGNRWTSGRAILIYIGIVVVAIFTLGGLQMAGVIPNDDPSPAEVAAEEASIRQACAAAGISGDEVCIRSLRRALPAERPALAVELARVKRQVQGALAADPDAPYDEPDPGCLSAPGPYGDC